MFQSLRIGTRLVAGFLVMACLVGLVSLVAFSELNKVQAPLTRDIPRGLDEIEKTSHLDALAQKIRYYDQVLTESARNYAFTEDRKWKYRYQRTETLLEGAIKEALEKGDSGDREIFSDLYKAKMGFVGMEYDALRLVDEGLSRNGVDVLESGNYWEFKNKYKDGLESYVEMRGKKRGDSLEVTSSNVDRIVRDTQGLVLESIRFLTTISLFALALALILSFVVSGSILKPLQELEKGVGIIGRGNLNHRIRVPSQDEIGRLAAAFNDMAAKLKESYSGLEAKVRDKTRELAQKVEEIQSVLSDLETAKTKIEEEKIEYQALIASIGDGMIATDEEGRLTIMNQQAEMMLGWKAAEIIGRPAAEVIASADDRGHALPPAQRPVRQALASGKKVITTANYLRRDGSRVPVSVNVSPIIVEGRMMGAIEIFRDITKEKEVDRMKTEFISTVSHELRTPLTVIREGVSLVVEGMLGDITPEQRDLLTLSLQDIDRLKRIIDNLLDISRIEAGRLEMKMDLVDMVSLAGRVQAVFSQRVKDRGLELRTRFSQPRTEIYADQDKIIQVLTNLVGNALKFTETGFIEISVTDKGHEVECAVQDSGTGIPPEDLPRVFGKFQQFHRQSGTGEKGTGLGLSIAKGIVELHKGHLGVESVLNQGTRFTFTLPKFSAGELFSDYIVQNIKESSRQSASFSILRLAIERFEAVEASLGPARTTRIIQDFEKLIKKGLRRQADTTIKDARSIWMILPFTEKTEAHQVVDRVLKILEEHLSHAKLKDTVGLTYRMASYPDDGQTAPALLEKIA
jgi:PAS domain S-box-containing protein